MALSAESTGGDISFVDYLASLPAAKVDALYGGSRWTCAALLRALPPLGKQCVLRLLHLDGPLTVGACVTQRCVLRCEGLRARASALRGMQRAKP